MDELLALNNIYYRIVNLPRYVKGLTVKKNDCYVILINERLDNSVQAETLQHELAHIELGQLELNDIASKYSMIEQEVSEYLGY